MKRSDIIRSIQVQFKNMRASDAAAIVDTVTEHIKESITDENRIEVRGFGTFQSRTRATKTGYNPCTGQPMHLDAGKTILFKPSRELTKEMNE